MTTTTRHMCACPVASCYLMRVPMNRSSSSALFKRSNACNSRVSREVEDAGAVDALNRNANGAPPQQQTSSHSARPISTNWLLSELQDPTARKAVAVEFMAQVPSLHTFSSCITTERYMAVSHCSEHVPYSQRCTTVIWRSLNPVARLVVLPTSTTRIVRTCQTLLSTVLTDCLRFPQVDVLKQVLFSAFT